MTNLPDLTMAPDSPIETSTVDAIGHHKQYSKEEIQDWLVEHLSSLLGIEPDAIDATVPFERYGLDSSSAVGLTGELEEWLNREVDPTLLYDYPTIEAQAIYLANELKNSTF
jgi:acyl carrier protein